MFVDLNIPVYRVMTEHLLFINPETLMSEVGRIFNTNRFHHLPVLDNDGVPLGMISKLDFNILLNHFTLFNPEYVHSDNEQFLKSILAKDVMNMDPLCVHRDVPLIEVIEVFKQNMVHSLIVTQHGKAIGIITPHDVMKLLAEEKLIE